MGLKTVDWDRVVALATAKIGADLSDKDEVRLSALINSAAQYIFDESRYHPRFLVLEPRTLSRGYIEPTEDSYNVFGAGTEEVNGLYVRAVDDDIGGYPHYIKYKGDGVTEEYHIFTSTVSPGLQWYLDVDTNAATGTYSTPILSEAVNTPPESGWRVGNFDDGEEPAPIVQALSEIDEIISYWDGARWVGANPTEVYGYPDQNGFRLTSEPSNVVYVAYKKALPEEYGDGEQGTTSDFPAEWLNYCAYSAAREWKESVRQQDASNPVSVRSVDKKEWQVLIKANRQGAFDTIANIWTTRYAKDTTITT